MSLNSSNKVVSEPYLSEPIEIETYKIYRLPASKKAKESYQSWNGYVPECTLMDKEICKYVPVQTFCITPEGIYDEILHECDEWMQLTGEVALTSAKENGGPFGAIVLQIDKDSNRILRYWMNHNQVTQIYDPTAHAEIMAIRSACKSLGVFNLGRIMKDEALLEQPGEESYCVLYSSSEPCPMCYSAISWSHIETLIFGATRFDASVQGVDFSDEEIYKELLKPYSKRKMKVCHSPANNSLDAFNYWKRSEKIRY